MKRNNVLSFPAPDHGLSSEAMASEITRIGERLASVFPDDKGTDALASLSTIEEVSVLFGALSQLVSRGRDRQRAAEAVERIIYATKELRLWSNNVSTVDGSAQTDPTT